MNRREFLELSAGAAVGSCFGGCALGSVAKFTPPEFCWGDLLHFGYNMWNDIPVDVWMGSRDPEDLADVCAADHLRVDFDVWNRATDHMVQKKLNQIVIDIGEGVVFQTHPEIGVKGSWTPGQMNAEVRRLKAMGLEPIPKLNFSAGHDTWLGEYNRMLSTKPYYRVCADLIRETAEIFEHPRFFHLGYDEESVGQQEMQSMTVVRNGELWWHDFNWFVKTVEAAGMRPWMWSDYYWHHPKDFLERMSREVVQSNWYYPPDDLEDYGKNTDYRHYRIEAFTKFDEMGYDQIPTCSNYSNEVNTAKLVKYCREHVSSRHLLGFLQTTWQRTCKRGEAKILRGIDLLADTMQGGTR